MSHVADVIVTCSLMEERGGDSPEGRRIPAFELLDGWLREREKCGPVGIARVDENAGGYKAPQCVIGAGAFNWLDIPAFLAFAWSIEWHDREGVQIMVKDEEDFRFAVYSFGQIPAK